MNATLSGFASMISYVVRRMPLVPLAVTVCGFFQSPDSARGANVAELVQFEFHNQFTTGTNSLNSNTMAIFNGHVGPYVAPGGTAAAAVPQESPTGVRLEQSGFGAMFAGDVPYAEFVDDIILRAQRMLYEDASGITDADKEIAAFRYLTRLYGYDANPSGDPANGVVAGDKAAQKPVRDEVAQKPVEDEARQKLLAMASAELPTVEETLAGLSSDIVLSADDVAQMRHRREVMQRRIEYAQSRVAASKARESELVSKAANDAGSVRCNFETMATLYGDAERARADEALAILRQALKFAPFNTKLTNAYLDVFYDKAVAELQYIKQQKVERSRYRLGFVTVPADQFVIDKEIEILRDKILPQYEGALHGLSDLLRERGGVNVAAIAPNEAAGTPLGYYVFKREQPNRNKNAAKFKDANGVIQTVPQYDPFTNTTEGRTNPVLFQGYKDYVFVLTILSDYLTDAADLARLYGMRGRRTNTEDDFSSASALIAKVQREVLLDATLIQGMFANFNPPPGDASGVNAARQGIATSLGEIEGVRGFLSGGANPLGFNPDFLVLIKEFPDATNGNQFDSYDALIRWIRNTNTSPLTFSEITYNEAKISYEAYRAHADQLFAETDDIETELADRYFEIIGAEPGSNDFTTSNPAPGSELYQVRQNINQVTSKIRLLNQLRSQLVNDVQNASTYKNVTVPAHGAGIDNALNTYLSSASNAYDDITYWNMVQTGAQAAWEMASAVGGITGGIGADNGIAAGISAGVVAAAGVINMGVQIAAEENRGEAEERLDAASAQYDADLAKLDLAILEQEATNELAALQREQIGNAVDYDEVVGELAQERAQETALLREVARITQKAEDNLNSLNDRYFADPVHQLRGESDSLRADNAFNDAQRWVFYTMRALEYKWNKPFMIRSGGKDYDSGALYRIRNFVELRDLIVAMEQFNTTNLIGFTREPFVDKLSLKKDFFGYVDGTTYSWTNENGTSETVSASEAFRRRLRKLMKPSQGSLEIPIDTFALRKNEGIFFEGPQYDPNGSVFTAGKYLDKIEWMKFNVISNAAPKVVTAAYSYGGTSYIRTRVPPCRDTQDDRFIKGEYKAYPFRYFLTLDNGATWLQRLSQDDTVKVVFSNQSAEPIDSAENPFYRNTFLKERSVAATKQALKIQLSKIDVNAVQDIEIYVRHLFVSRELPVCE